MSRAPEGAADLTKAGKGIFLVKEDSQVIIRPARMRDVEKLLEIYAPYVTDTAITFEYAVPSAEEFAGRVRDISERYPYLVAEQGEKILGYAYAHAFNGRSAYDWAVETSIYVDRAKRRTGVGGRLHRALETALKAQGILNMNACIGVPAGEDDEYLTRNSQEFHAHLGYRPVGEFTQCGYKFGRWYSMIWMEKHIGLHLPDQPPVKSFREVAESLGMTF